MDTTRATIRWDECYPFLFVETEESMHPGRLTGDQLAEYKRGAFDIRKPDVYEVPNELVETYIEALAKFWEAADAVAAFAGYRKSQSGLRTVRSPKDDPKRKQ